MSSGQEFSIRLANKSQVSRFVGGLSCKVVKLLMFGLISGGLKCMINDELRAFFFHFFPLHNSIQNQFYCSLIMKDIGDNIGDLASNISCLT